MLSTVYYWLREVVFVAALLKLLLFVKRHGIEGLKRAVVSSALALPGAQRAISGTIEAEVDKAMATMFKEDGVQAVTRLPEQGTPKQELLAMMDKIREGDVDASTGKCFAYVYPTTQEHKKFVREVYSNWIDTNALNPTSFPSLRRYEVEVCRMTASLLHGDASTVGAMTSGGTESALLAVLAARERARKLHPHITEPEIVLCDSAHPCWPKAAHFFGMKTVYTPMRGDYTADPAAFAAHIGPNTVLLVASAFSYPVGVVDPIEQLSALAVDKKLPLHVDACIGGFILPFVEKLGRPVPKWDFRVRGVTSISIDCHKYGYAAKGASCIMYRSPEYRDHQYFAFSQWPGGLFVSSTMLGTRAGGSMAAAWASMMSLGESGYVELADRIMQTADYLIEQIKASPELRIMGNPCGSVVSFQATSPDDLNLLAVADVMEERFGWKIERLQRPTGIHMTLNPAHFDVKELFAKNLKEAMSIVQADPGSFDTKGTAATYGMVAKIPSSEIVEDFLLTFMSKVYRGCVCENVY